LKESCCYSAAGWIDERGASDKSALARRTGIKVIKPAIEIAKKAGLWRVNKWDGRLKTSYLN
jgi:hypothetical protein